jgi:hypothetical protein
VSGVALSNVDLQQFLSDLRRQLPTRTPDANPQAFFKALKTILLQEENSREQTLRENIAHLRAGLKVAIEVASEDALRTAPHFNIFQVLKVSHKEAAHSDFLAQLLDPRGQHGQRTLFLSNFLRVIQKQGALQGLDLNGLEEHLQHTTVNREATIITGRCDLTVQLPSRFFVLMEVKVWAPEGDQQLARYARWLQTQRATFPHRALVFLTPNGRAANSSEASTYTPLSFRLNIRDWLRDCLSQITPLHVKAAIEEYVTDLPEEEGTQDGQTAR